jgi:DNA invertase Pin-like site-specific DNA recombinase
LSHLLTTVTDFKERGIAFRSLIGQMDTTTPQGELLFHVFGALVQFEQSLGTVQTLGDHAAWAKAGSVFPIRSNRCSNPAPTGLYAPDYAPPRDD